jgi:hypothetical protein
MDCHSDHHYGGMLHRVYFPMASISPCTAGVGRPDLWHADCVSQLPNEQKGAQK